jgi:hypothetical protein
MFGMSESDFLEVDVDRQKDPDGSKLAALLRAQRSLDRLTASRRSLTAFAALLAAPLALAVLAPRLGLAGATRIIAAVWLFVAAMVVYYLAAEVLAVRKMGRYLAELSKQQT